MSSMSSSPLKVLFAAFELPPLASAGIRRPLGFLKHFGEFGVEPSVVTADRDTYVALGFGPFDEGLAEIFSAIERVERIPCHSESCTAESGLIRKVQVYFSLLDRFGKDWEKSLIPRIDALIQKHRPEAIYATMPPFFMGPLWCRIAARYKLPLVLDFRDAWSQWLVQPCRSYLHYSQIVRLERRCLVQADHIVTTSPQTRADLLKVHGKAFSDKISVVYNGYDREIDPLTSVSMEPRKAKLTIGYVGSFYYFPEARDAMLTPWWKKPLNRMLQYTPRVEDWLYRSPYFFFKALNALLREEPELRDAICVRIAGTKPKWIDAQVSEFGLEDLVEFAGHMPHADVLNFQRECDALLLTSAKVVGGRDYSIASKTYEYFTLNKPILAFVTEGAQRDVIEPSGLAVICDPDNISDSSRQIRRLIKREVISEANQEYLSRFHRRETTRELVGILKRAVDCSRAHV